jgi:hypothetical protein
MSDTTVHPPDIIVPNVFQMMYADHLTTLYDSIDIDESPLKSSLQTALKRGLSTYGDGSLIDFLDLLYPLRKFGIEDEFKRNFKEAQNREAAWEAWIWLWQRWTTKLHSLFTDEEEKLKRIDRRIKEIEEWLEWC